MDVVIVSDWSIPSRRYQSVMDTMTRVVSDLESDDVQYAVGIVDRTRGLRVLHKFNVRIFHPGDSCYRATCNAKLIETTRRGQVHSDGRPDLF